MRRFIGSQRGKRCSIRFVGTRSSSTCTVHGEAGSAEWVLGVVEECWGAMEAVGLRCMDVLLQRLHQGGEGQGGGPGSAEELLSRYCDPCPLPTGKESSSVFDVFLYPNDRRDLSNCADHIDPGFFSVLKDDTPGLQARDEASRTFPPSAS